MNIYIKRRRKVNSNGTIQEKKNNSEGKRLQLDVNERLRVNALMPVSDI